MVCFIVSSIKFCRLSYTIFSLPYLWYYRLQKLLFILLLLSFIQADAVHAQNASALPTGIKTQTGEPSLVKWKQIEAGEEACCAYETPYSFFYRPGQDTSRLLIYFQGGGACWDWVSCSGMFDTSVEHSELTEYRGIFDFSNAQNPFQDYAILFIPYCTGDVHIGTVHRTYGEDMGGQSIAHHGARNVDQVLQWAKTHLNEPQQIVVAGASAGSYGAIFHAPRIAKRYPRADLVTIGDSGVPLLNEYEQILQRWGAGSVLRPIWGADDSVPLTLEQAYSEAATPANMRAVVQITSDKDRIQSSFYLISGSPTWREDSYKLLETVEHKATTIYSFIVAGTDHGLMRTDAFYTYEADGMLLSEWINRLIAGESVTSVRCASCSIP